MLVKSLLDLKSFTICLLLMAKFRLSFSDGREETGVSAAVSLRPVSSEHPVTSLMNKCHKLVSKVKLLLGLFWSLAKVITCSLGITEFKGRFSY